MATKSKRTAKSSSGGGDSLINSYGDMFNADDETVSLLPVTVDRSTMMMIRSPEESDRSGDDNNNEVARLPTLFFKDYLKSNVENEVDIELANNRQTMPEVNRQNHKIIYVENPINKRLDRMDISSIPDIDFGSSLQESTSLLDTKKSSSSSIRNKLDQLLNISGSEKVKNVLHVPFPAPLDPNTGKYDDETGGATSSSVTRPFASSYLKLHNDRSKFVIMLRIIFIFAQGLLAGFAFVTLYMQSGTGAIDLNFLLSYGPSAQAIRRFYYIVSAIATIGSIDMAFGVSSTYKASSKLLNDAANSYDRNGDMPDFIIKHTDTGMPNRSNSRNKNSNIPRHLDNFTNLATTSSNSSNNSASKIDNANSVFDTKVLSALNVHDFQVDDSLYFDSIGGGDSSSSPSPSSGAPQDPTGYVYIFLTAAALMYLCIHIITVCMSTLDTNVALSGSPYLYHSHPLANASSTSTSMSESNEWASELLAIPDFNESLVTWRALDQLRFALSIAAWLITVIIVGRDLSLLLYKNYSYLSVLKSAQLWRYRSLQLMGLQSDLCSSLELQQIYNLQKIGLAKTENALRYTD